MIDIKKFVRGYRTQAIAAEVLGISNSTLSNWKTSKKIPSKWLMKKMEQRITRFVDEAPAAPQIQPEHAPVGSDKYTDYDKAQSVFQEATFVFIEKVVKEKVAARQEEFDNLNQEVIALRQAVQQLKMGSWVDGLKKRLSGETPIQD